VTCIKANWSDLIYKTQRRLVSNSCTNQQNVNCWRTNRTTSNYDRTQTNSHEDNDNTNDTHRQNNTLNHRLNTHKTKGTDTLESLLSKVTFKRILHAWRMSWKLSQFFFFRNKLSRLEHVLFLQVSFANYFRKQLLKKKFLACHYPYSTYMRCFAAENMHVILQTEQKIDHCRAY